MRFKKQQVGEDRTLDDQNGYDLHLSVRLGKGSKYGLHKDTDKKRYPREIPLWAVEGE